VIQKFGCAKAKHAQNYFIIIIFVHNLVTTEITRRRSL